MHINALTAPEQRVLGCLIEKKFTTPDQYPLSLNALRMAANQSTNRSPVVKLDEHTINEAAQRLSRYGIARLASGHSSRAVKYRHLAEEVLGVQQGELALLCVLLLRGPQTPGELKARTERMVSFENLEHVDATLEGLVEKGYVARLERRPGQKEERWGQLLGGDEAPVYEESVPPAAPSAERVPQNRPGGPPAPATSAGAATPASSVATAPPPGPSAISELAARVARLEAEVADLRAQLGA